MNSITLFLSLACLAIGVGLGALSNPYYAAPFVLLALVIWMSLKMANTWQKFVVLRAGKLQGVRGPACSSSCRSSTRSSP